MWGQPPSVCPSSEARLFHPVKFLYAFARKSSLEAGAPDAPSATIVILEASWASSFSV